MKIYEFHNRSNTRLELADQNGNIIVFNPRESKRLGEYFLRYTPKTLVLIKQVNVSKSESHQQIIQKVPTITVDNKRNTLTPPPSKTQKPPNKLSQPPRKLPQLVRSQAPPVVINKNPPRTKNISKQKPFIGGLRRNPQVQEIFNESIQNFDYSISNNIGVGILSFNRLSSIKRLLDSIRKHADLSKTKIFISDESTDNNVKEYLNNQNDIILLDNKERLGIAGNTNRLLQALSRFKHILLLNDDVEILSSGWDSFYFDIMNKTGYKHFCYRQVGIYGAQSQGTPQNTKGTTLYKIDDKPHGAVMAIDKEVINMIGFFDESFKEYGMEHVDYSRRIHRAKLQPPGFFDAANSEKYFKIHNEPSVGDKSKFKENKDKFNKSDKIYINHSKESEINGISIIIPLRVVDDRLQSFYTVLNNIRSQHFPVIDIVISEEDTTSKLGTEIQPANYIFTPSKTKFNKCKAFNAGVIKAKYNSIILHDADILAPTNYTQQVFNILKRFDACHIGSKVLYLDPGSTQKINNKQKVGRDGKTTHMAYTVKEGRTTTFVGGSIATNRQPLYNIGGFNESFVSWGEEDVDIYHRLQSLRFFNERSINFLHLYHKQAKDVFNKNRKNLSLIQQLEKQYGNLQNPQYLKKLQEEFHQRYLK